MDNNQVEFRAWPLNWKPEHIERFWNWLGKNPAFVEKYFSKRYGDSIVSTIIRYVDVSGVIADIGAGPGYIVEKMLRKGSKMIAVDTSSESLLVLENRLQGIPNFIGVKKSSIDQIPLETGSVDGAILIEVIEHIANEGLQSMLTEVYRIIKPGGWVVITTPNEEVLAENETMCPNCGCIYHAIQHVQSWSPSLLSNFMSVVGFQAVYCRPTLFSQFPIFFTPFHRLAYKLLIGKLPHLLYVGKKAEK